jgi:hypothetical protein
MNTGSMALKRQVCTLVALWGCSLSTPDHYYPDAVQDAPQPDTQDTQVDVPPPDIPVEPPPDTPPDAFPDSDDAADGTGVDEIIMCVPGTSRCRPDGAMEICHEGGEVEIVPCPFGCADTPEVHCRVFVPSNVTDADLLCLPGTTPIAASPEAAMIVVDTDSGAIYQFDGDDRYINPPIRGEGEGLIAGINFAVQAQPGGAPELAVFSVQRFDLPADLALVGLGARALVILSCEDVTIGGLLVAGAVVVTDGYGNREIVPGPGGWTRGEGPGAGGDGAGVMNGNSGGGGGAAFGAAGGTGGSGTGEGESAAGGTGGSPYGEPSLVPLLGGSGGGTGDGNQYYGYGGSGGGALQVSTPAAITVLSGAAIEAGGHGGIGSDPTGGGGGAGSGGGILLEAQTITVQGGAVIAANGGGGGSSGQAYSTYGVSGEKGKTSRDPAAGGAAPTASACRGGNGSGSMPWSTILPTARSPRRWQPRARRRRRAAPPRCESAGLFPMSS